MNVGSGDYNLKNAAHPIACVATIGFKGLAIFLYLFAYQVTCLWACSLLKLLPLFVSWLWAHSIFGPLRMSLEGCLLDSGGGAIMMKKERKSGDFRASTNSLPLIQSIRHFSGLPSSAALFFGPYSCLLKFSALVHSGYICAKLGSSRPD